jgi:hypothetical protein
VSVEALSTVLHHSRAKGTVKLVLIGIANHDGDGGAWPTVATLAKYANVHPRNVQKALEKLVSLGEIRVEPQAGGLANMADCDRPNLYHVKVRCPVWCDGSTQHRDQRKRAGAQLTKWHGPQPVDIGVAQTPPPGATATPGGGASATPPPGADATRTVHSNLPLNTGVETPVTTGPACGECGQSQARCTATPHRVSGHRYYPRSSA